MRTIKFWAKVPMVFCALLAAAAEATKLEADTGFGSTVFKYERNQVEDGWGCQEHSFGTETHCTKHWFYKTV